MDGIGKVVRRHGMIGVAIDRPGLAGVGEFPEHRRRVERRYAVGRVVGVAEGGAGNGEGPVGNGLRRNRCEPAVTDGKAFRQPAEHGQRLGRVHAHDGRRLGTDELGVKRMGGTGELVSEAGDEAVVGRFPVGGGSVGTKQLFVGRYKPFSGVRQRVVVGIVVFRRDRIDRHRGAVKVAVGLRAVQSVEVAGSGVEISEQVVERTVLQHEEDYVVD